MGSNPTAATQVPAFMAESGRRASLRGWCPKGREGSNPSKRTMDYPIVRDFENHSLFGMSRAASILYAIQHGWELEIMIGDNYNVVKSCYSSGAHHSFVLPKAWQVNAPVRMVRGHTNCPCRKDSYPYSNFPLTEDAPRRIQVS